MNAADRDKIQENLIALGMASAPPAGRAGRNSRRGGRAGIVTESKRRSTTAGVQPHQANQFNESAKADGIVGVEYDKNGDMLYSSERAKQKELRRRGLFAKDSIFSPKNN
jgi:hypothetical protein